MFISINCRDMADSMYKLRFIASQKKELNFWRTEKDLQEKKECFLFQKTPNEISKWTPKKHPGTPKKHPGTPKQHFGTPKKYPAGHPKNTSTNKSVCLDSPNNTPRHLKNTLPANVCFPILDAKVCDDFVVALIVSISLDCKRILCNR